MKPFFRIARYLLRYKFMVATGLVCSFGYAAMNAFSVYLIGPFMETLFNIDSSISHSVVVSAGKTTVFGNIKNSVRVFFAELMGSGTPREILTRLCLLIIVVILLKNIFSYLQGYIMAYVEQGMVSNLREDIYVSYHRMPLRFFQKRKTGDMISRVINDCNTINENLNNAFISLMKEPVNAIVLLGFMVIISWKLTLFTFLIAPPSLYIIGRIGKKLRRSTVRTQDRISTVTSVLEETISGIRIVKAFAMEKFEIDRFRNANNAYFRSLLKLARIRRLAPPVTEFLGVGMAMAVLWIGGNMVLEKKAIEPGNFLAYLTLMFVLMQSAKRLSEVNVKVQVGIAATARVFEVIDRRSDVTDPPSPLPLDNLRNSIVFNDVWYEYEPGVPVLKGINLIINAGDKIAVVGPSGGGKSTMLDLIPRFFDPVKGWVEIDGHNLREYRLNDLRRLFGIVTQETILFHDTIKANIAYGRPDTPFENIIAAAKTANAHNFIMEFDNGYDTVIGDRGTKLSGGQKQRLVIARAILKNPPVLLFDEATSALDSDAEAEVQAAIEKLMEGRTSFIIAHRLSTIRSATRIVVMDKGRIVEYGTHVELFNNNGIYRRLHDLQFSEL
ncbi:MAG: ABC transporter ATP-binding protein [Candidatus Latescibacteria bacterium]|nr:ABC transporter ATP-binding protein [Candidatus Latescibacterota bacterium]